MQFLTRFALRNPVVMILLVLIIAAGGIVSSFQVKEEMMPNISIPIISVLTTYPGASPSEVAQDVTNPLEKALNGAQDVQLINSNSVANVSQIQLQLDMNADLNTVQQNIEKIINQVPLPKNAEKPNVLSYSFGNIPVMSLTVASNKLTMPQLKNAVNKTIVPALQGVAGVASVQTGGADPDNVVIQFDPVKLSQHNLTVQQVLQDLQADNVSTPLGSATMQGKVQSVQLNASLNSLQGIKNLPIPVPTNPAAGMQAIGSSIGQLGQAVGQVANGVGQVGQGLAAVQAENKLLTSLQQIQGQLFGAELALNQQLSLPPAKQNPQAMAQLKGQIASLQSAQQKLTQQLTVMQQRMPAQNPAAGGRTITVPKTPAPSATTGNTTLSTVPLSALATVSLQPPTTSSINRTNGQPSILVSVTKTDVANTVDVANGIHAKLAQLSGTIPVGVHISTLFDSAASITESITSMLHEAILGAVFAVLVILLFLRNWLTTLIAVVSIPISLLISIMALNNLGITLNIMSLGGLTVATGRVVDDSIVVIENIYRTWKSGQGFGKKLVQFGTREVGQAILASTLATMAVFLPLGMVSGMVGKLFHPFAITVVVSLASSLLVAVTIVPLLAWLFVVRKSVQQMEYTWLDTQEIWDGVLHPDLEETPERERAGQEQVVQEQRVEEERETKPLRPGQRKYQQVLAWCLNHKAWVIVGTVILFIASVAVLPLVGTTYLPNSVEQSVTVSVTMPVGTPREQTDAKAKQVEQALQSQKADYQQVNTQVGSSSGGLAPVAASNTASLTVQLNPKTDVNQFVSTLREKLKPLATGGTTIQVKEQMGGGGTSFDIVVMGSTDTSIAQAAKQITTKLSKTPGLANVQNNLTQTQPAISVVPDLKKAGTYGLTAAQISSTVQQYLSQQNIGIVSLGGQSYDMYITVNSPNVLNNPSDLTKIALPTQTGQSVTLGDVATVKTIQTPTSILHQNGRSYAEITADYTSTNTGKVMKTALADIDAMHLPPDIKVQQSTTNAQQNQSFSQLIEAIVVAIVVVYIVMLITFGEWSAPFSILFSMPVALIGAFFGTVIGRQPISVSSLIGILMLMGIVVTNAIVLIHRVEQQRRRGYTVRGALLEAGTTRLRPILMTAIATVCGLLPLAFGTSAGTLISQGLAVVVIGGLITSTVLTLCIVPLVYELLHFRIHRREQRNV